jgi:predicted metal-dependent hydrolase
LLEPYWTRAGGEAKEVLQGLIQVAVGYQHLANGNLRGASALLEEGSRRLHVRMLGLDLEPFARAVARSLARLTDLKESGVPPFPRARKE